MSVRIITPARLAMTTKSSRPSRPKAAPAAKFPVFPPRYDMQNPIYLADPAHQAAVRRHLGSPETTIVLGEVPIGPRTTRRRQGLLIPDLLIAFNINRAGVIASRGYSIEEQGKPPDFVLEIASQHTRRNDYETKRIGYANFGVPEYWRFDPTGGEYYPAGLVGDRLVDGAYVPIAIHRIDENRYWSHSEALNLDLCWECGQLRWYDPVAQRYLRTYDEAEDDRKAAESRADRLEEELRRLRPQPGNPGPEPPASV